MANQFFQDMVRVKNERREIKEQRKPVSPPAQPPESAPAPVPKFVFERQPRPEPETEFASVYDLTAAGSGGNKSSRGLWMVAGASILFLLFALSLLFSEAKIIITPKTDNLSLSKNFFAVKGLTTDNLSFDLVAVSGDKKTVVEGGEEREVSQTAEGVAVIYNIFSSASQRLDINTRLLGSNGKIYKTKKQITVPGLGQDGTPGSMEIGIYASEAGEGYNSSPIDFSIVGFKGTPKYSKFYARSKGEITGGLVGKTTVLADSTKNQALNDLKDSLNKDLAQKAAASIPPGFILFPGATS